MEYRVGPAGVLPIMNHILTKIQGQLNGTMGIFSTSGLGTIGHPPAKYHQQQKVPQLNPHLVQKSHETES